MESYPNYQYILKIIFQQINSLCLLHIKSMLFQPFHLKLHVAFRKPNLFSSRYLCNEAPWNEQNDFKQIFVFKQIFHLKLHAHLYNMTSQIHAHLYNMTSSRYLVNVVLWVLGKLQHSPLTIWPSRLDNVLWVLNTNNNPSSHLQLFTCLSKVDDVNPYNSNKTFRYMQKNNYEY